MDENHNDEISLKELILKIQEWFKYLLSKWYIILIASIVGGVIGFVYAIRKIPTYTGTLTFVLSTESKGVGGLASLAGLAGIDLSSGGSNGAFEGENIIELLKSRKIVKGALFQKIPDENITLINLIGQETGFLKGWQKNKNLSSLVPFPDSINKVSPRQDSLINVIHGFLLTNYVTIAKPDKKLSFYQVKTTSPNEKISIYLTKNLVNAAAQMYIETKTKTARQTVEMLQREADELRGKVSSTIYSSASTVDQTFALNPAFQVKRAPIQENQVQAQAYGGAYAEVFKNLELAKMNLQKETPLYQVIDEPSLPLIMEKLGKMRTMILGGIIAGFLCLCLLLGKRIFKGIMGN